jgi:dihydrofolate reductase
MGELTYSCLLSLDGYVADEQGDFGWAAPDEEVHRFVNELERPIGTYLYGRRMYETMVFWETAQADPERPTAGGEYAEIWRDADKIVYSRTLEATSSARTRLEREFDPAAVRELKASSPAGLSIGGPTLAAAALAAGLVDEIHLFVVPAIVGGGLAALPDDLRADLELRDERRFASGTVYLRYGVGR